MSKNIKIIIGAVVIVLIVLGLNMNRGEKGEKMGQESKEVVKIGVILPLTGNLAFMGEGSKNAVELALAEMNKNNNKYKYEVIFEDDSFNTAKTASAVNKLISIDKVDVVTTFASPAGSVVSPIAEKSGVVHFAIASDPKIASGKYNFINWTPPQEEVDTFIKAAKERNVKKLAVFGQPAPGIIAIINELKRRAGTEGLEIVYENVSNFGDKDFRTQVQKVKKIKADYLLMVMFSPELEILTKQLREAKVATPITAIESFELSDNPALFEGLWYVNAADYTSSFNQRFNDKHKKNPTLGAANMYDIVGLVVHSAEKLDGKKLNRASLAEEVAKVNNYNGALGEGLKMGDDHIVISKGVVRMIKDGKPITIEK